MKKKLLITLGILVALAAATAFTIELIPAKFDYGTSEIYSLREIEAAANLVADYVNNLEGCKLFAVRYDGDETSRNNLDYCNSLAKDGKIYTDCIVFTSVFRSPVFGGGAWNANSIYTWSWYLARAEGGEWEEVTHGYA